MTATHYETLGVACDAAPDVIKAAYRELIKRYHPDRINHHGLALTQAINAAYHVLRDPDRRATYDLQLQREARRARAEQEEADRRAEQQAKRQAEQEEAERRAEQEEAERRAKQEEAKRRAEQEQPRASSSGAGAEGPGRASSRSAGLYPAGAFAAPVIGAFAGHIAGAVMLQTVAAARGIVDYVLSLGPITGFVNFALSIGIGFICWFIGILCTERSFAGEALRFRSEALLFPSFIILAFGRYMLFSSAFWPQFGFAVGVYLGSRAIWRYPAAA